jgi:hypothetical protein
MNIAGWYQPDEAQYAHWQSGSPYGCSHPQSSTASASADMSGSDPYFAGRRASLTGIDLAHTRRKLSM